MYIGNKDLIKIQDYMKILITVAMHIFYYMILKIILTKGNIVFHFRLLFLI